MNEVLIHLIKIMNTSLFLDTIDTTSEHDIVLYGSHRLASQSFENNRKYQKHDFYKTGFIFPRLYLGISYRSHTGNEKTILSVDCITFVEYWINFNKLNMNIM